MKNNTLSEHKNKGPICPNALECRQAVSLLAVKDSAECRLCGNTITRLDYMDCQPTPLELWVWGEDNV